MNQRQTVQIALLCLEALSQTSQKNMTPQDLSRQQGLPLPVCLSTVYRLIQAGIVELREDGSLHLCRSLEDLTALEILNAVWASEKKQPAFRMLVGGKRAGVLQKTLEWIHAEQARKTDSYING